jgi:hypothetical protein
MNVGLHAAAWVLLWADRTPPAVRTQALEAIAAERLACDVLEAPAPLPRTAELRSLAAEAYSGMRFADAHDKYDEAIAEATVSGAAGLGAAELADLYLGRALVHEALGESGFDDFVRAARVAPSRLLDPAHAPPNALQSFARAQQAVRESPRGTLIVEAPAGAAVFVDGEAMGRAPLRLDGLPWGERILRVEAPGRRSMAARVDHAAPETTARLVGGLVGPPTLAATLGEARARGASTVLIVTVPATGDVLVERVAVAGGRVDAVERTSPLELRAALRRLLAPAPPPRRILPWAIGGVLVGAAATAAVILLTRDEGGDGIVPTADPSEATRPR